MKINETLEARRGQKMIIEECNVGKMHQSRVTTDDVVVEMKVILIGDKTVNVVLHN